MVEIGNVRVGTRNQDDTATIATRARAVPAPSDSPAATAITAATAPSADEIGATTPTPPIRKPV